MLNYAELCTLLARAASVVNNRPIGVKNLTKDELVPLTVNQLLLGRTSSVEPVQVDVEPEGYIAADLYLQELLVMWWKLWKQRALPSLLPYYRWEESRRHRNLKEGDICLLLYETKIVANYRLCKVMEADVSDDDCVRTVTIGYLPRKALKHMVYHPVPLESKKVAVQRLVLILPVEEQTKKDGPGSSHSDELELEREQPRASPTSTPAQSLPLTSRPGGPGWKCRAGLNYGLVHCVSTL